MVFPACASFQKRSVALLGSYGELCPESFRRLFFDFTGVGQHRRQLLSRVTALKAASSSLGSRVGVFAKTSLPKR